MKTFVKWGLIATAGICSNISVHYQVILNGGDPGQTYLMLAAVILGIAVFFSIRGSGLEEGWLVQMPWSKSLKTGLKTVVLASIASAVFMFFYLKFINPAIGETLIVQSLQGLEETDFSEEKKEQIRESTKAYYSAFSQMNVTMIAALFAGSFLTFISAASMKLAAVFQNKRSA